MSEVSVSIELNKNKSMLKYAYDPLCVIAQVSTKLDLNDDSKEGTSPKSTPRSNTSSGSNSKISPKIEGVRVTVDTSDGKKTKGDFFRTVRF